MSNRCSIYFDNVTLSTFDGKNCGETQAHCHIWWDVNEPHIGIGIPGSDETFYIPIKKAIELYNGLRKGLEYWGEIDSTSEFAERARKVLNQGSNE